MESSLYKKPSVESLQSDIVSIVAEHLTPVALKYKYSKTGLESRIQWLPTVLVLGNYSSGKSTFINEFVGGKIQNTGQAPTDDCFTVITAPEDCFSLKDEPVRVLESREGSSILFDPQFPFNHLKEQGQNFASHLRYKKINSPVLRNLAIIDTPGMLDSVTEKDRGYKYQEVIGEFAKIADLILFFFDPHKAGTVRETYDTLRVTLPKNTFENRVILVLNRIDECSNLMDLIRVYGSLCWNISQMTGAKDIPQIHLSYSSSMALKNKSSNPDFLPFLENNREALKKDILKAPKYRLDHLMSYLEIQGDRMTHFLEALLSYGKAKIKFYNEQAIFSVFLGITTAIASWWYLKQGTLPLNIKLTETSIQYYSGGIGILFIIGWGFFVYGYLSKSFHRKQMKKISSFTNLDNQWRHESWNAIEKELLNFLQISEGRYSLRQVKKDYKNILSSYKEGLKESRKAVTEIFAMG